MSGQIISILLREIKKDRQHSSVLVCMIHMPNKTSLKIMKLSMNLVYPKF